MRNSCQHGAHLGGDAWRPVRKPGDHGQRVGVGLAADRVEQGFDDAVLVGFGQLSPLRGGVLVLRFRADEPDQQALEFGRQRGVPACQGELRPAVQSKSA